MKFRKFLCFVLIFAIMVSLVVTAFADALLPVIEINGCEVRNLSISRIERAANISRAEIINSIENDINVLNRFCIPTSAAMDVRYKGNHIEYIFNHPELDYCSTISVEENPCGDVVFYISEGECNDILEYKADGAIFLDGKEVVIERPIDLDDSAIISPQARYEQYSEKNLCPGATYSKSGSPKPYTVNVEKRLLTLATDTIAAMLGAAIGGIPGAAAGVIFAAIARQIKSKAQVYCPSSTAVTCDIQKYEKSPQDVPLKRYYKYTGTYYSSTVKNNDTKAGTNAYYCVNYFA